MGSRKAAIALTALALYLFVSGWFVANLDARPELRAVAHQPGFASAQQVISALFVVGLALPSFYTFVRWQGAQRGLVALVILGAFGIAVETIALHTGIPYGHFAYGSQIGPKLPGGVPWTVPFAWTPLLLGAMFLVRRFASRLEAFAIRGALCLVVFDLVLDPGAVAQKFWFYLPPGAFYGVPAANFAGWLTSGIIGLALLRGLSDVALPSAALPPTEFPRGLLASTWLILVFWTSVTLWRSLWIPAGVGIVLWVWMGRLLFAPSRSLSELTTSTARPSSA